MQVRETKETKSKVETIGMATDSWERIGHRFAITSVGITFLLQILDEKSATKWLDEQWFGWCAAAGYILSALKPFSKKKNATKFLTLPPI